MGITPNAAIVLIPAAPVVSAIAEMFAVTTVATASAIAVAAAAAAATVQAVTYEGGGAAPNPPTLRRPGTKNLRQALGPWPPQT